MTNTDDQTPKILLPRLYERDIDVLLQEEFRFNPDICAIFAKALRFDDQMQVNECQLSVVDETGETDLVASFSSGKRRGVILIENKIDAAFQPRQPERYRERARALVLQNVLTEVFCVLVAPTHYLGSNGSQSLHFDAIVSYEDVSSAVAADGTQRSKYRAALLLRAVEQARASYTLTPAPEVTNVWERVYNIALKEFPSLQMPAPSAKGSQSKWIIFKADLPPRITIDWKITKAAVELSFWKGAVHTPLQSIDLSMLSPGASVAKAGETIAIRVPVSRPPASWIEMTDCQIRDGLSAAVELLMFYRAHSHSFG